MKIMNSAIAYLTVAAVSFSSVHGHGLMEYPPSRNQLCGVETKPHEVIYGDGGVTPDCEEPFTVDFTGGYSFMSVLTHDYGRSDGRSNHVCGFDSETWQGGATPWDIAMDWPTTDMEPGRNEIRWNIAWGPHFLDTVEFKYWITNPDFEFDSGSELDWDDFMEEPFCVLTYDDGDRNGNPDVIPDISATTFKTYCDVPARGGHHVIYGEWGRNEWTLERFHGCIDVNFEGDFVPEDPSPTASPPDSDESPTPGDGGDDGDDGDEPVPAPDCVVNVRPGANAWWAGLDVGYDVPTVVLDFSDTGLDLGSVTVDASNFNSGIDGQRLTLTKPDWISSSNPGYVGFNGNNVAELASFDAPFCGLPPSRRNLRKVSA